MSTPAEAPPPAPRRPALPALAAHLSVVGRLRQLARTLCAGAGRRLQSATAVSALNPLGLGSGPDLRAAPYVLYYNPTQWSPAAAVTGLSSVCVASCPTTACCPPPATCPPSTATHRHAAWRAPAREQSVLDGSANSSLSSWPTTCRYFSQSSFALNSAYSSVDPWCAPQLQRAAALRWLAAATALAAAAAQEHVLLRDAERGGQGLGAHEW